MYADIYMRRSSPAICTEQGFSPVLFPAIMALSDVDAPVPGRVHEVDAAMRETIELARKGDRSAFARIFDLWYPRLYRYCLARIGDVADAEDVAAETMLSAWKALPRFNWTGAPFGGWLFAICRTQLAVHARAAGRRRRDGDLDAFTAAHPGHGPLVDARLALQAELSRLPADQRRVVEMRFYGSLTSEEIAHALGKSAGAVRQLQLRALTSLRTAMLVGEAA